MFGQNKSSGEYLSMIAVYIGVFIMTFIVIMSTIESNFSFSEEAFITRISKLTVDIKYENPIVYKYTKVASHVAIVATGTTENFKVKYEAFPMESMARIAYDLTIENLKEQLYSGVIDAELVSNEIQVHGKANQIPVQEYAIRVDDTIYRVIRYEDNLVQIEVGVGEKAYALSELILELLEFER